MKITADTNILVRAIVEDHPQQAALAQTLLAEADTVAIPIPVFCELAWVLARGYRVAAPDIGAAISGLIASANVVADRPAVAAGLALLEAGGDFADGAIAWQGAALGGKVFASFDREAVRRLADLGFGTLQPG